MVAHARQLQPAPAAPPVAAPDAPASQARAKHLRPDAAMLRAALESSGTSGRALAERMHLSHGRVQQWMDGAASLSVERIEVLAAAAPGLGRELARRVVDRMRAILDAERLGHADLQAHLLACMTEIGRVAQALQEAMADGHVTELERAALRREVRQLVERVDALRVEVG